MKTLKLFNAVLDYKSSDKPFSSKPVINNELGIIIEPNAVWAENQIVDYYKKEKLSGNDLNKTFHKSWKKIKESPRFELLLHQILHYTSTYGSNFQDEIYIPTETLKVPELKELKYKVIKAYTKDELIDKSFCILNSGIALDEKTIDDIISLLVEVLGYKFTGNENIKNKEAQARLAELYNIYPENPVEFLRFILYRTTDSSLLIKSPETINSIKHSSFNPSPLFHKYGLTKLSEIFNRFKPLFLAYKNKCHSTINKISKLSKKNHKPMVSNPLNDVTNRKLVSEDMHWLKNATSFALLKALQACDSRIKGQNVFIYKIRNGKSWTKDNNETNIETCKYNYNFIIEYLKTILSFENKTFYLPDDIVYSIPTSEKMFAGNIPLGSRFYGSKLAIGIYWKNEGGAIDLDLSAINIGGKVGWNSKYSQNNGKLMYSGDITNAPNGAVEYLHAKNGLKEPSIILNNVYAGASNSKYKIIVGKGTNLSVEYMMNPNNLFVETDCETVQKQTIIGIIIPYKLKQCFTILNMGLGNMHVSSGSSLKSLEALYQQWKDPLTLNTLVKMLGGKIIKNKDEANYNLSLDKLEKDTFINLLKPTKQK